MFSKPKIETTNVLPQEMNVKFTHCNHSQTLERIQQGLGEHEYYWSDHIQSDLEVLMADYYHTNIESCIIVSEV